MTRINSSVFKNLALAGLVRSYEINGNEELLSGDGTYVSFSKATDVVVSRWYPGYRVTDLTGPEGDEAVGIMLAESLDTNDSLEEFRRLLSNPRIAIEAVTKLLPRAGVPVKTRSYLMSESMIAEQVQIAVAAHAGDNNTETVTAAYVYAVTRIMSHMGIVLPSQEQRIVGTAKSYALSAADFRKVLLIESLKDVFSDQRLATATKMLDTTATPQLIGEALARMFRDMSYVIPEIKLRLEELDVVVDIVSMSLLAPERVPNALAAHPALRSLTNIANMVVASAAENALAPASSLRAPVAEVKEACNRILQVLQTAKSIEMIPLSKYTERFGEVLANTSDGIRRGLVLAGHFGQQSRMEVADVRLNPSNGVYEMAMVAPDYVPTAAIAGPLSGTVITPEAINGLANMMADDIALTTAEMMPGLDFRPVLLTMQVEPQDLLLIAMERATTLAFVKQNLEGSAVAPLRLVFGCQIEAEWRTAVSAATPAMAFFGNPAAAVLYTSKAASTLPSALPSRSQSIQLSMSKDVAFQGLTPESLDRLLVRDLAVPYQIRLPLEGIGSGNQNSLLKLDVHLLGALLGFSDKSTVDRGDAFYAPVREPGVDGELNLMLDIALAYAKGTDTILADKARSWLIEQLVPAMMHPAIQNAAERALNTAIIKAEMDVRAYAPQFKELAIRAYFGVLLAVLNRFGKLDTRIASALTTTLPVSGLSVRSQLTMASLPGQLRVL